jgi:hypothetical protein
VRGTTCGPIEEGVGKETRDGMHTRYTVTNHVGSLFANNINLDIVMP